MTSQEYKEAFGKEPENDDIERATCKEAGQSGHYFCGVCSVHNKPRFMCCCHLIIDEYD